ncbi:MAG: crossover junction endodeoxyribonuclease RuvC [Pseudomonadota bacterium]
MMVTILGIDPGLRATGWGAIAADGSRLSFLAAGTITPAPKRPVASRLADIFEELSAILDRHGPDEAAVEQTFVSRDGAATLKLGQARGVALLAPALAQIPVAEYAPNLVKKSVVGAGHADKRQIRHMIEILLPKANASTEHACDALAVAICHASHRRAARVAA